MSNTTDLRKQVKDLAEKAQENITSMHEISEMDKKRKNIQRGKLIAYEHVISIIEKIK